jgi:hypothetical protein
LGYPCGRRFCSNSDAGELPRGKHTTYRTRRKFEISKITDVLFLSPIQDPVIASQKQRSVDVLCVDSTGVQTIVEMQDAKTSGFKKRAQYFAVKLL